MRKHNQIHTLGALHYTAHFQFFRKLKDFKYAVWSEKYSSMNVPLMSNTKQTPFSAKPIHEQVRYKKG